MNEELIRELIAGQKEQTELMRRYLWRLRFSLLSLLLLMTVTAIGMGALVYRTKSNAVRLAPTATTATWTSYPPQGTVVLSGSFVQPVQPVAPAPLYNTSPLPAPDAPTELGEAKQ
jgi:hypothetical protein